MQSFTNNLMQKKLFSTLALLSKGCYI